MNEEHTSWVTPQEAADLLKVDVWTIRRWCREGKIEAQKIGFNKWRVNVKKFRD